jgi:threonine dehydrogenase-like Zn-dependent dehydrogenase
VVVNGILSCRHCRYCRAGLENLCADMRYLGIDNGQSGGFAERVAVPAANVFALPDSIDDAAGTVVSEYATAIHVVRLAASPILGSVLLIGFGRHGSAIGAVFRARHPDAAIGAIDPASAFTPQAASLGVDILPDWSDAPARADAVVDTVGSTETLSRAIETVAPGGAVVLLGAASRVQLDFPPYPHLIRKEARITGSVAKTSADFRDAVTLVGSGRIAPSLMEVDLCGPDGFREAWRRPATTRQALAWHR